MRAVLGFLRFCFRSLFVLLALVGALVVGLAIGGYWIGTDFARRTAELPDRFVLTFDLAYGVVDQPALPPLARLSDSSPYLLRDLIVAIERAATDERVAAVYGRIGNASVSLAHAQEIAAAVWAVRRAGKPTIVFAEDFASGGDVTAEYMLASAFESIWLQPTGTVGLTGIAVETPFLAETLEKLDVQPQFQQRYEFKSFPEIFTRAGWSDPARESLAGIVSDWHDQAIAAIADGRGRPREAVRDAITSGPYLAEEALAAGLVDRLAYAAAVEAQLGEWVGHGAALIDAERYVQRDASRVQAAADTRFALIYGIGPVVPWSAEDDGLFGFDTFSASRVSSAIEAAADDAGVAAILLRIDSPGGSHSASDTVWNAVRDAKAKGKPVIVSFGETAASGGYFVAMAADRIVALPGTLTGSVGVFGGKFVASGLWQKLGVTWARVETGERASMWSANRPFTAAEEARFATMLDAVYADFTSKLADGRNLSPEEVEAVARGRIWTGAGAEGAGLVDAVGGLSTALSLAREAAGLDADEIVAVEVFPPPRGPLERLRAALERGLPFTDSIAVAVGVPPQSAGGAVRSVLERWFGPLDSLRPPAGVLQAPPVREAR